MSNCTIKEAKVTNQADEEDNVMSLRELRAVIVITPVLAIIAYLLYWASDRLSQASSHLYGTTDGAYETVSWTAATVFTVGIVCAVVAFALFSTTAWYWVTGHIEKK